jgi:hypothetical protein
MFAIKIHSLKIQGKSSGLLKREAFKAVACWRRMGNTGYETKRKLDLTSTCVNLCIKNTANKLIVINFKKCEKHLQIRASSSHFCRWQPPTSDKIEQLGPARVSRPPGSTRAAQTSDECSDLKREIFLSIK